MQTGAQAKAPRKACDEGKALGNPKAAHCHCTLDSLVRLPLLPLAAILEICLWVSVFVWAQINTERAANIVTLAERLPDIGWYFVVVLTCEFDFCHDDTMHRTPLQKEENT
jgi:hypothetical protein